MVDRAARNRFAESIRALAAGQITNDQFEDARLGKIETSDPAIGAIYQEGVWHLYSDLHEHHLRGRNSLSAQEKAQVARWILFLKTDLPYSWPELRGAQFFALLLANILTFGLAGRRYSAWFKRHGDARVWPFSSQGDYASALQHPRYLAGGL